ncbi:uncharacterized protein LOC110428443 [Herrania umbratica]|uniref:Uncharacterized protein LOC110428443 n=1 Tax=Herrania umbratica TaxID=108875 RepID=A0A6J1BLJ0_9ROSI|nr:uncharacterized protein LOC110428443 [Herrania umbratica]
MAFWNPVIEKVEGKLTGWKSKLLSFGGRISLLKSVLVNSNIGLVVGNGENIYFWTDEWIGTGTLAQMFPRIFALANNKNGRIAEYDRWEENVWRWDISLRRNLFDWEVTQWDRLETLLIDVQISKTLKDDMVWKGEANGLYTTKSFCKKLMEPTDMRDKIWKNIWASLAPHRIEAFVWQLLHGKVGVKEELIWMTQCWEISKIRVASWANAKWPNEYPSVLTTFMFPEVGCGGRKKTKERKSATWEKPKLGQLKFNVDGAAQGCPGPAEIGGWIKDPASASWRLRFWMNQIERFKELCTEWEIRHSPREANQEADSLAKAAIHLQSEILGRML